MHTFRVQACLEHSHIVHSYAGKGISTKGKIAELLKKDRCCFLVCQHEKSMTVIKLIKKIPFYERFSDKLSIFGRKIAVLAVGSPDNGHQKNFFFTNFMFFNMKTAYFSPNSLLVCLISLVNF